MSKAQDKVNEAIRLIREAEEIADREEEELHFDLEYGMGGWYSSGEWHPSSHSC